MKTLSVGAVLALVVLPVWSYGNQVEVDQPDDQTVKTEVPADGVEKTDESAPLTSPVSASENQEKAATTDNPNKDKSEVKGPETVHDSEPGPWDFNLDRLLQATGILGVLAVIWQTHKALGKATRANRIAQNVADVSVRPWLQIKSEVFTSDWTSGYGGADVGVSIPVENVGKTPAVEVSVATKLVVTSEEARTDITFSDWCDEIIENRSRYRINDIFPTMTATLPESLYLSQRQIEDRVGVIRRPANLMNARVEYHLFVCVTYTSMSDPTRLFITAHSARARLIDEESGFETPFFEMGEEVPKDMLRFERGRDSRVV